MSWCSLHSQSSIFFKHSNILSTLHGFSRFINVASTVKIPLLLHSNHLNPYVVSDVLSHFGHAQPLSHSPPPSFSTLSSSSSSSSSYCFNLCRDIQHLKLIHAHLIVSSNSSLYSSLTSLELVILYARFGAFHSSLSVLDTIREPDTKVWNLLMKSFLGSRHFEMAVLIYRKMRHFGVKHDTFTLPIVNQLYLISGCDLKCRKMVHCVGIHLGFSSDLYFCNTLIELYVKCGCLGFARQVFDEMLVRDHVSWTSMIAGFVGEGDLMCAFELFCGMRRVVEPNSVTLITMLQACCSCGDVVVGKQFHSYILKSGFMNDKSVRNSLFRMYTYRGTSFEVETLFLESGTDVVTWNTLISFYISLGSTDWVVEAFQAMMREMRPSVESLTLIASALSKCGNVSSQSQQLHCFAIKSSLSDHIFLTCLMDLYSKCSDLNACIRLYNEVPCRNRNTITWSTLMTAFTENGQYDRAFELFKQLQSYGGETTAEVLTCLLDVCTDTGALHMGKEIHGHSIRNVLFNTLEYTSLLETSILNMYIKCGSISYARHTFRSMADKDVIAWTSMIEGFGTYGFGQEALAHFDQMVKVGIDPNPITFLSILSACSHSGLTKEGCELLIAMKWNFRLEPELNHYTCVVDLLGRSGKLKDALAVILKMVPHPDSRIWGALLAACRVYMDRKIGEFAANRLLELEPDNMGYHIVLSNMQASAEQWTDVERLRTTVTELNLPKMPGWSCVDAR